MPIPTLADLPAPPPGKTGFPWTQTTPPMVEVGYSPRVSIVTPSFNQGMYLEETLRSVLLQSYANLEYIVIDGGSTDASATIIQQYAPWLTHWVSERDQGQVFAVDKGWQLCTGEIIAYLNSDDTYLANAIHHVVAAFQANPDVAAICGGELTIDHAGMVIGERRVQSATFDDLVRLRFVPQPAIFLRRSALLQAGRLDTRYQHTFDFELWTRLVQVGAIHCLPEVLATTRWHADAKTLAQRPAIAAELEQIFNRLLASPAERHLTLDARKKILADVNFLAASIYFQSLPRHNRAALRTAWQCIAYSPRDAWRLVCLAASEFKRFVKRAPQPVPWRLDHTGVHWSVWSDVKD